MYNPKELTAEWARLAKLPAEQLRTEFVSDDALDAF